MPDEKIREDLLRSGWKEPDIAAGFSATGSSAPNSKKLIKIIAIVIIAALFGGGVYFVAAKFGLIKKFSSASSSVQPAENKVQDFKNGSSATENGMNALNCDADIDCFVVAARSCSPATLKYTQMISLLGVVNQIDDTTLALKGTDAAGRCSFSDRVDNITFAIPDKALQEAKARGVTDVQIQSELESFSSRTKREIGVTITCSFTPSHLVQLLTKWKSIKSVDLSDFNGGNCVSSDQPVIIGKISLSSHSPSGNIIKGSKNITLFQFDITASTENDIHIRSVDIYFTGLFGKYISNVKLADGASTILDVSPGPFPVPPTPPTKDAVLLFNKSSKSGYLAIGAHTTKTFSVYGDIDVLMPVSSLALGVAGISIINPDTNSESTTTVMSGIPLASNILHIVPSEATAITILSPTLGEGLSHTTEYGVEWISSLPTSSNLDIYLDKCDGESCTRSFTIAKNVPNSGYYVWRWTVDIAGNFVPFGQYSITIVDPTAPSTKYGHSEKFIVE